MVIVIEVKYAEDGKLEHACREALRQIEFKRYKEGAPRGRDKNISWSMELHAIKSAVRLFLQAIILMHNKWKSPIIEAIVL